jgi:hypothetical protein
LAAPTETGFYLCPPVTLPAAPTPGNLLLGLGWNQGGGAYDLTQWTVRAILQTDPTSPNCVLFARTARSGDSNALPPFLTATDNYFGKAMCVWEISGLNPFRIDAAIFVGFQGETTGTTQSLETVETAVPNELAIASVFTEIAGNQINGIGGVPNWTNDQNYFLPRPDEVFSGYSCAMAHTSAPSPSSAIYANTSVIVPDGGAPSVVQSLVLVVIRPGKLARDVITPTTAVRLPCIPCCSSPTRIPF